jgi:hypothetical protein
LTHKSRAGCATGDEQRQEENQDSQGIHGKHLDDNDEKVFGLIFF